MVAASKSASARATRPCRRRQLGRRRPSASSALQPIAGRPAAPDRQGGGQGRLQRDQPVPDPEPQLVGGHPAEGDQHQLVRARPRPRRGSGRPGRRSCTSCRCRRWPPARSCPAAAGRRRRTSVPDRAVGHAAPRRAAAGGRPGGPGCRTGSARPGCRAPPRAATARPAASARLDPDAEEPLVQRRRGPRSRACSSSSRCSSRAAGRRARIRAYSAEVLGANGSGSRSPVRCSSTRSASTGPAQAAVDRTEHRAAAAADGHRPPGPVGLAGGQGQQLEPGLQPVLAPTAGRS